MYICFQSSLVALRKSRNPRVKSAAGRITVPKSTHGSDSATGGSAAPRRLGRSALRCRREGGLRVGRVELSASPDRRGAAAQQRGHRRRGRRVPRACGADPRARRRDFAVRAGRERRGGHRLLEIHGAGARDRSRGAPRARRARRRVRCVARRRRGARPDIRPRPGDPFGVARALGGSEGTCALTLQAEARLITSPRERVLVVMGFEDICAAGDAVGGILAAGPIACEGLDERIIGGLRERGLRLDDIALLPPGKAWMMVEFGADTAEEALAKALALPGMIVSDKALMSRLWTIRETGASATALNLGAKGADPIVGWEDAAVDPLPLRDYLREFQALGQRFGHRTSLYGHFRDRCLHAPLRFDLPSRTRVAPWRGFLAAVADLVVKYGGSLSGEHGDGQAKAEFLPRMVGPPLMQACREV